MYNQLTNQVLLDRYREGEESALGILLSRYEGLIYSQAYRLAGNYDDANDIASEANLRLCRMIRTCRNTGTLPAWIKRVVYNTFCDMCRRSRRRPSVSLDHLIEQTGGVCLELRDNRLASSEYSPEYYVETKECKSIIDKAIAGLPAHHRRIIELFYRDERTHEEISAILGIAVGTVKSRLSRARNALHQKLGIYQTVLH